MPIFHQRLNKLPRYATFSLTERGREKVQEFRQDPKSQTLTALETRGSCDLDELAEESGLSRGQVEQLVKILLRQGYVAASSSLEGSEFDG